MRHLYPHSPWVSLLSLSSKWKWSSSLLMTGIGIQDMYLTSLVFIPSHLHLPFPSDTSFTSCHFPCEWMWVSSSWCLFCWEMVCDFFSWLSLDWISWHTNIFVYMFHGISCVFLSRRWNIYIYHYSSINANANIEWNLLSISPLLLCCIYLCMLFGARLMLLMIWSKLLWMIFRQEK